MAHVESQAYVIGRIRSVLNAPTRSVFAEGLSVCIDILRLRRGPADMPAAPALLLAILACQILLTVLLVTKLPPDKLGANPLVAMGLGAIVSLACLKVVMHLAGHPARFMQTASAIFGCELLLAPLVIAMQWIIVRNPEQSPVALVAGFVGAVSRLWLLVVVARILRAATEWHLAACIAVILAIAALTMLVLLSIYPLPPDAPAVPAAPA